MEGYEEIITQISVRDQGPFPLFHVDFEHDNIVVDDDYNVLGVIDWEHASSMPWECIHFPWTMSVVPALMVSDNYDKNGVPVDFNIRTKLDEQKGYMKTVQETERIKGLSPELFTTLANQVSQDFAYAMKLYVEDGLCGQYANVLGVHQKKWVEEKGLRISEGGRC